jgi:hypothetical protein
MAKKSLIFLLNLHNVLNNTGNILICAGIMMFWTNYVNFNININNKLKLAKTYLVDKFDVLSYDEFKKLEEETYKEASKLMIQNYKNVYIKFLEQFEINPYKYNH